MATVNDQLPPGEDPALLTDPTVHDPRRRDFFNIAAVSFAGAGALAIVLPLINQMSPSADVLADSTTDIDLAKIAPGQAIKASFRKQPLFVRNLMPKEIAEADAVPLSELRDPETLEHQARPQELADHLGRLHASGLHPAGRGGGREPGRVRRLFLPLSRFAIRHGRAHPQRPGAQEPGGAALHLQQPDRRHGRLRREKR